MRPFSIINKPSLPSCILEGQFTSQFCTDSYKLKRVRDYFPYGKVLREFSSTPREKYILTHHERDQETGLDQRGARWYDSDVARFLSLDPAAMDYPTLSDYVYVADNPTAFIDPDGRKIVIHYTERKVKKNG